MKHKLGKIIVKAKDNAPIIVSVGCALISSAVSVYYKRRCERVEDTSNYFELLPGQFEDMAKGHIVQLRIDDRGVRHADTVYNN